MTLTARIARTISSLSKDLFNALLAGGILAGLLFPSNGCHAASRILLASITLTLSTVWPTILVANLRCFTRIARVPRSALRGAFHSCWLIVLALACLPASIIHGDGGFVLGLFRLVPYYWLSWTMAILITDVARGR